MATITGASNSGWAKLRPSRFGIGLATTVALAAAVVIWAATMQRSPSPSPQAIQTETINNSSDMYAVVQYEKQIGAEYTSPQISTVTLKLLPLVPIANPDAEILAPNGTILQEIGKTATDEPGGWRSWTWPIMVRHSGRIGPAPQDLVIRIRYSLVSADGRTEVKEQTIPINMIVQMLDFPLLAYLAMIALGIVASYLAVDGAKVRSRIVANGFGEVRRPIIWIIMSLILTPIVYVQFKQALGPVTDQAVLSLLLALPFGSGLDFAVGKAAEGRA